LPASVGPGHREGKEVSPDQRLSHACRLEGGAPGDRLLRHPPNRTGLTGRYKCYLRKIILLIMEIMEILSYSRLARRLVDSFNQFSLRSKRH